ncbi:MAG TPA: response regulator, partial [Actinomycetota bacterium]|nr:response regulator [Actinomycetota bacterium]
MVTSVNLTAGPDLTDPIRVFVAEGQALFRQALRSILEEQPDIVVVGEAGDIERMVSEAERTRPDMLLLDESLSPGSLGPTASLLRASVPQCQVVVIASKEDDAALLAAVEAGVV